MSRKTRRHPNRSAPKAQGPALRRVEGGHYETHDGAVRIENMNDGKRDACWVARDRAGKRIAHGTSLRDVRGKVGKILEATP